MARSTFAPRSKWWSEHEQEYPLHVWSIEWEKRFGELAKLKRQELRKGVRVVRIPKERRKAMPEVNVIINQDGSKVEVDAKNFEGSSCKDFMGNVMKAIGETEEEKKKPEFFRKAHQTVSA
jgi:hypothetical protein